MSPQPPALNYSPAGGCLRCSPTRVGMGLIGCEDPRIQGFERGVCVGARLWRNVARIGIGGSRIEDSGLRLAGRTAHRRRTAGLQTESAAEGAETGGCPSQLGTRACRARPPDPMPPHRRHAAEDDSAAHPKCGVRAVTASRTRTCPCPARYLHTAAPGSCRRRYTVTRFADSRSGAKNSRRRRPDLR